MKKLFLLPADLLLWFQYNFPKNITDAYTAERRMNSMPARVIMATVSWAIFIFFFIVIFFTREG